MVNRVETPSKRIDAIDVAKGIGIILVILGHMEEFNSDTWKQFAASFHMPLFFVISGVLLDRNKIYLKGFKDFVIKMAKKLLIPYILWGLIYSSGPSIENLLRIGWGNNDLFGYAGLWFLPTLFMAECIYYLIVSLGKKYDEKREYVLFILCGILSWTLKTLGSYTILKRTGYPFSFDIALTAAVFMAIGSKMKNIFRWTEEKLKDKKTIIFLSIVGIYAVVFLISIININFVTDRFFNRVVMAKASYGFYPLFLIGATLGVIATFMVSVVLRNSRILSDIGRNSLVYMCINHFAIATNMSVLNILNVNYDSGVSKIVISILVFISSVIICKVVQVIVTKFVPVLAGR